MNDDYSATLKISRDRAAELGRETVAILKAGSYETSTRGRVHIRAAVDKAVAETVTYGPTDELPQQGPHAGTMTVEVRNMTTLAGVRLLQAQGRDPAALNFASATHPGGGFLTGALAQEEYLARSSGLWACLAANPMYDFHQGRKDSFYNLIAGLFRQALEVNYLGFFDHVLFAITDWSEDDKYIAPFLRAFGGEQVRLPVTADA